MKILINLCCVIVLAVIPMHVSNTSELVLTDAEIAQMHERIKKSYLLNKIFNEYDLFYSNLDSLNPPEYVVEFIHRVACDAIESKSLPSIVIAQASLETGYGRYNKLQNNLFGIKGRGIISKTKEYYNGKFITINAEFQHFNTVKDAFDRHNQILVRYGVFGNDYKVWIDRIVACGYATDPNYDIKLNKIIDKFQLYRLDNIQKLNKEILKIGKKNVTHLPIFTYNTLKNI